MSLLAELIDGAGAVVLEIEAGNGTILSCAGAVDDVLGVAPADLEGRSYRDAFGLPVGAAAALSQAISSATRTRIPPLLVFPATDAELLVDGLLVPLPGTGEGRLALLLFKLAEARDFGLNEAIAEGSLVAVLGVDQLTLEDAWGAAQMSRLMDEIHGSLLGVIRKQDYLSRSLGRYLVLVLRGVSADEAQDICRAMLSHVNSMPLNAGRVDRPRICIGLAQARLGISPLQSVLSAHDALEQAQEGDDQERIRMASDTDQGLIAARAFGASSLFAAPRVQAHGAQEPLDTGPDSPGAEERRPEVRAIESGIDGYVDDNMEGAIDQAVFLAGVDMPVAIIGPRGTGKLYVARIIHRESGGAPEMLVPVDCREFRSRRTAMERITRELERSEGKTLVFKSPQLMNEEVQVRLARQLSTRTLADAGPPRYLPRAKYIALFPDNLERMVRHGGLSEKLASVFAGFPIYVPPIRDRKQAVLRWAHKILGQESTRCDRLVLGFTPDAEQAMLQYDWPGNISEMRQCIVDAMAQTDKQWITPVDLGIFKGISADGVQVEEHIKPFLEKMDAATEEEEEYKPSSEEQLSVVLGELVNGLLESGASRPLGSWLEDEIVLAALDRYRGDLPAAANFLHTRSRNISRWMPKIEQRGEQRNASKIWQEPRRVVREWIRATPQLEQSPLSLGQDLLLAHVVKQATSISVSERAKILGVSTPTYHKRLQQLAGEE